MIILFLIDTSSSMNQKTAAGMSYLDVAKSAVEHFVKVRNKDPASRNDRYMLVTCAEGPSGIKIGWKENFNQFLSCLKTLEAYDMTQMGPALKKCFDLLNQYRLQAGVDNYGQGRYPFYIEQGAAIILITDACQFTSFTGVNENLTLPNPQSYSTLLTLEPFRWDQHVHSIVLRFPAAGGDQNIDTTNPIAPICEVTGGSSKIISSMRTLFQYCEELVNIAAGTPTITVNIDYVGKQQLTNKSIVGIQPQNQDVLPVQSMHANLYVRQNSGFWPIPENYFPTSAMSTIPPRNAHPTIHLHYVETEYNILDKFPVDKYDLDPSTTLAQYMIKNRLTRGCFKAYMQNSGPPIQTANRSIASNFGEPFGYFKLQGSVVSLYLLPYNFPRLFQLLEDLFFTMKSMPTNQWKQDLEQYLISIPPYYIQPIKLAIKRYATNAPIFPDHLDGSMNYHMASYLKKLKKQAKVEVEQMEAAKAQQQIFQQQLTFGKELINMSSVGSSNNSGDTDFRKLLQKHNNNNNADANKNNTAGNNNSANTSTTDNSAQDQTNDAFAQSLSYKQSAFLQQMQQQPLLIKKNPFDIDKAQLLQQFALMSSSAFPITKDPAFIKSLACKDASGAIDEVSRQEILKHSVPISQMGNFDQVVMRKHVLRDPLAENTTDNKKINFGSPYQKKKQRKGSARQSSSSPASPSRDSGAQNAANNTSAEHSFLDLSIDEAEFGESAPRPGTPSSEGGQSAPQSPAEEKTVPSPSASPSESISPVQKIDSMEVDEDDLFAKPLVSPAELQQKVVPAPKQDADLLPFAPVSKETVPPFSPIIDIKEEIIKMEKPIAMVSPTSPTASSNAAISDLTKEVLSDELDKTILQQMQSIPNIHQMPDQIVFEIYSRMLSTQFKQQNEEAHDLIMKLIRAPVCKDTSIVLDRLSTLAGSAAAKKQYVQHLVQVATQFKKRKLAMDLKQVIQSIS